MILHCLSLLRLNSLCNGVGVLLLFCWISVPQIKAIQISAVYSSGCSREVGVFLGANKTKVRLLNLDGEVKVIPVFNISYIAQYPISKLPIQSVQAGSDIRMVDIKTLYQNEAVDLVKGWMIDYGDDQISFLTTDGDDTVIDINDIWEFRMFPQEEKINFSKEWKRSNYQFIHPYPFSHCQKKEDANALKIYPQHLLEEPILIKAELDRLRIGFDRLKSYDSDKKFYPEPQVYDNSVKLSLWASLGLRHGASKNRNSSFIPSVASQLSEGPYGFQRIWVTGSAPMPYSVHEEPQIQAYYRMKSDFVHFSMNYDISRFLIGDNSYHWVKEDLKSIDTRWNEKFHIGGGFDFSAYSIEYALTDVEYGIRGDDDFFTDSFYLNKVGVFMNFKDLSIDLYYGFGKDKKDPLYLESLDSSSEEEKAYKDKLIEDHERKSDFDGKFTFFRVNVNFKALKKLNPRYSFIYRSLDFKREANYWGEGEFEHNSLSLTNALYLSYPLGFDLSATGFIALEYLESRYGKTGLDHSENAVYPKGGARLALTF